MEMFKGEEVVEITMGFSEMAAGIWWRGFGLVLEEMGVKG